MSTTIGVLGQPWRADVTAWGDVIPWDDEEPLRWYVAADDRWHLPEQETAVRQRLVDGAPVIETRVRIPTGDAVHTVMATADGLTVVEVENDSSMPIAIAFSRGDLLTSRPPADVPIEGIDLPEGAVVVPIGHRASVRVAVSHDGRGAGALPDGLPAAQQVARGWTTVTDRAGRVAVGDVATSEALTRARCAVALEGPSDPAVDPVGFLLGVGELVRMGDDAEPWVLEIVDIAEPLLRRLGRGGAVSWDDAAALWSTAHVLAMAGESRGVADVEAVLARCAFAGGRPSERPDGVRAVAWVEGRLARPMPGSSCTLLPEGFPDAWLGTGIECYRVPGGSRHTVSFAIRWHGERPAVLWEIEGPAGLGLTCGADERWSSIEPSGEALWAPPPGSPTPVAEGESFT